MIGRIIVHRVYWLLILLIWSVIVMASYLWNSNELYHHAEMMVMERGRHFHRTTDLVSQWNMRHSNVYVPVTKQVRPNPYLDIPQRDAVTTTGRQLTTINHAYMIRQISELAEPQGVHFHLTSLKPLNPDNQADPWETEALRRMEQGEKEVVEMPREGQGVARYMLPLYVEPYCMACHAQQGYQVGDLRGGLSVNIDAGHLFDSLGGQYRSLQIIHGTGWLLVTLLMLAFLTSVRRHTVFLEGVSSDRGQRLDEAEEQLKDLVTRDTTTGIHTIDHFKTLADNAWTNAIKNHATAAIILLEIDHFHDYADNYGALEGDFCLKQVTKAITDIVNQPGSIIARYGAASFIIMLTECGEGEIRDLVARIHGAVFGLKIPHETSEVSRVVTVTGAYSVARPKSGTTVMALTRKVRDCLVRSKKGQRNKVYHCT